MVFLKALSFIAINMLGPFLLLVAIKVFLFYPRREMYWRGKPIWGTPGFLFRKKKWLIDKLDSLIQDYLRYASDQQNKDNYIYRWEDKIYHKAWDKFAFIDESKYLPKFIKNNLHEFFSSAVLEVVRQFLRNFIPYLMEKYNVKSYIQLAEEKLDIDTVLFYFNKYVFKYLCLAVLGIAGFIGFFNMLIFLFIR